MEIRIRGKEVEVTEPLRQHVVRRLGFTLSRFDEHIGRVTVALSTVQDRAAQAERCCQIRVALRRVVRVRETDADVFVAVDRAVDRAARSVARAIELDLQQSIPKTTKKKRVRA